MDVVEDMKAVEAQIGGRVGDAVSGVKARTSRLRGAGSALMGGLRGLWSRISGLGTVAVIAVALVVMAACASPIAIWSAYHTGSALQAERDRAAAAEAVAIETARQKGVIERASTRLAKTDAADRAEIKRLKGIAARLDHKRPTKTCPPTVFDVLHGAGYTPVPGHE